MTWTSTSPDGATLLVRDWQPTTTPWAWVLLVHGVAEHSGRYERTGRIFADAGVSVTAFDLRGHGGSSGRRGDVERWTDLTDDVGRLAVDVRRAAGGGPVVLMGHSMGGLLVLDAVLSGAASPDLLLLSSPAIADALPRWQHALAPIAAPILPTMRAANAWGPDGLSSDPGVGQAIVADPLCLSKTSFRLGALSFATQKRVRANLTALHTPAFVTHGDADPIIPPQATVSLGALPGVTRKTYPGLRHETLNEPEGPQVAADMIDWLRGAVAARSA